MSFHTADEVYLHKLCTLCRYVSACLDKKIFCWCLHIAAVSKGIVSPNWRSIFAWAFLQTTFLPWSRRYTGCPCTSVKSECLSYFSTARSASLHYLYSSPRLICKRWKNPSWLFDFVKAKNFAEPSIFLVNSDRKWVQETFCTWLIKFSKHVGISLLDCKLDFDNSNSGRKRESGSKMLQSANGNNFSGPHLLLSHIGWVCYTVRVTRIKALISRLFRWFCMLFTTMLCIRTSN